MCGCSNAAAQTLDASPLPPILQFDPSGKFLRGFGAGLFVFPHGIHVDRDGNIWAADASSTAGKDGKGHVVMKFNREGKVLLTLGKLGVAGDSMETFNRPSAVVTAPNGDIFVSDGHGGDSNAHITHVTVYSPEGFDHDAFAGEQYCLRKIFSARHE